MTTFVLPFGAICFAAQFHCTVTGIICLQLNEFSVWSGGACRSGPRESGAAHVGRTCAINFKLRLPCANGLDWSGPGHKEAPAETGTFYCLENTVQSGQKNGRSGGGGGGSTRRSWAALSGPRGYTTRGQCLVSLSGHSSRTHNGAACCGARSVSAALQSMPQMWPLCLAAPGTEALCERRVSLGSRDKHGMERKPGRSKKIPFS